MTLEGVVDNLMPGASMVDIIKRHLRAHTDPEEVASRELRRLAKETLAATHGLLGAAGEAQVAMRMLTRGQLRVNLDLAGTEDPLEDFSRTANRLTMGIIVAGLFIGSSVVYYARIQPVIFGIPVIGFVGYIAAFFLGIWIAPRHHPRRPEAPQVGDVVGAACRVVLTFRDIYVVAIAHRCRKSSARHESKVTMVTNSYEPRRIQTKALETARIQTKRATRIEIQRIDGESIASRHQQPQIGASCATHSSQLRERSRLSSSGAMTSSLPLRRASTMDAARRGV